MFVIIQHDFDNMENYTPHFESVIGYIKDELDADAWIEAQKDNVKYKGYDGKMYPRYTKQKIEKIAL